MGSYFREYIGSYKPVLAVEEDPPEALTGDETIDEVVEDHVKHFFLSPFHETSPVSDDKHSSNTQDRLSDFRCGFGECSPNKQHTRMKIVRCFSSFVVSTIVSLGIFYLICSSQFSITNIPLLHKEHDVSVWPSLLVLFGFMVFVCAVTAMILVGAEFTGMQKAMMIFLAILMHLQSANSIIEVFVTLVGGLFMGWYALGKKNKL